MESFAGLSLSPLSVDDVQDQTMSGRAPTPLDAKSSFAFPDGSRGIRLNVHALPSPVRCAMASPVGSVGTARLSPAGSPVAQGSPTYVTSQQHMALQARCRKAETQQQEAQGRVMTLEREVQELRAKLESVGTGEQTQAIWNAAKTVVGDASQLEEIRAKDALWIGEARSRFEEQHSTELWRLLREHLSVGALSDVARSVGGGPLGVGKLLFDATPSARPALERRHSQFVSRDMSQQQRVAAQQAKPPLRAASRHSLPIRAATVTVPVMAPAMGATLREASPSVRDRIQRLESGSLK
jgi:hypothetical protein